MKHFKISVLFFLVLSTVAFSQSWRVCIGVFDGDTIVLNGNENVRLIGVDTPELTHPIKPIQYFAKKASEFTSKMVFGKKVRLEYDQERVDKYGRILAYVYLEDGRMLNEEIIKSGHGFVYTKYPFKYLEEFRRYEKEARERGLGLWGNEGMDEYYWLLSQDREPFLIYEMGQNWWAIKYKSFVKVRLTSKELKDELDNLRIWVNEFNEKDLRKCLLKNGWREEKK